jgi:VanZ family protein
LFISSSDQLPATSSEPLVRSLLKYWLPVVIWLAVMFAESTELLSAEQTSRFLVPFLQWLKPDISTETLAQIHFFVRKLGHVGEYAILAILLWRALRGGTSLQGKMAFLFASVWLVCGIFAAGDEFHQSFVPSRTATWRDVIIDLGGAFIGLAICWLFATRKNLGNIQVGRL